MFRVNRCIYNGLIEGFWGCKNVTSLEFCLNLNLRRFILRSQPVISFIKTLYKKLIEKIL